MFYLSLDFSYVRKSVTLYSLNVLFVVYKCIVCKFVCITHAHTIAYFLIIIFNSHVSLFFTDSYVMFAVFVIYISSTTFFYL